MDAVGEVVVLLVVVEADLVGVAATIVGDILLEVAIAVDTEAGREDTRHTKSLKDGTATHVLLLRDFRLP